MLQLALGILVLIFGVSQGTVLEKDFTELNSRTVFANKVQEFLEQKENAISLQCSKSLKEYVVALASGDKLWALEMFDAGGKIPSGILEGNLVDLGSFDECLKVEGKPVNSKKIFGKYCIATTPAEVIKKLIPKQLLGVKAQISDVTNPNTRMLTQDPAEVGFHLATCLPDACSVPDIRTIYAAIIGPGVITFKEEYCQSKATQPRLDGGSIATISFLGVILGIMLVSTCYDVVLFYLESKPAHPLLLAFSVFTNGKKLMATSNGPNQINCLHGIRVISTMWVIIGHRYSIQFMFPMRNFFHALDWVNEDANMFILGAPISVDTFFLISGLVLVYVYMSAMEKGIKFNVIMFYLHRYLRLAPVLAVIIVIHITLLRHMGSGPLWPKTTEEALISRCENNWWKSMLFFQNFGTGKEICLPQTWYLSVDMQLFLLSPILLIPLKYWPKSTLFATGFLSACSIIACFITSWSLELSLSVTGALRDPHHSNKYMRYYYIATWTRAAPWFIGFILGYCIFKIKQRKSKLVISKTLICTLWALALVVLCICVFGGHDLYTGKEYDRLGSAFYLSLIRPSWAIAVAWVIFACVTKYGGPVDWFLSLPIFQVLSRITFTLYMVHYTIIFMINAQMRTTPTFNNPTEMYAFWGDFALSLAVALVFTLAFESPMITIEKVLFGGGKKRTNESTRSTENGAKSIEIA